MPKKMTVGDLRAALVKFTDDIPVCVFPLGGSRRHGVRRDRDRRIFPSAAAREAGAAPSSINLSIGDAPTATANSTVEAKLNGDV